MNTFWIVFGVCISSVIGEAIYKRILSGSDNVMIGCGAKTTNLDVEWLYKAKAADQPVMIIKLNGKSGSQRKGSAPMRGRVKLRGDSLEISPVETRDAGEYTCMVNTEVKGVHSLYIISVSVTPPPPLPQDTLATLDCQLSGLEPIPSVEWISPDGVVTEGNGKLPLDRVKLDHHGKWVCRVSKGNGHNESLTIEVKGVLTTTVKSTDGGKTDQNTIPPRLGTSNGTNPSKGWSMQGLSLWVWVGIGAGSLVLVILLVASVLLLRRNRGMRKRRQRMMMNRQPLMLNDYCHSHRRVPPRGEQGQSLRL